MEKKCAVGERRLDLFVAALVAVACCAIVVIVLWAPVARAQLILSGLPGVITVVTARSRLRRQKRDLDSPGPE
jgi:Flp pilus assembly protein TadB